MRIKWATVEQLQGMMLEVACILDAAGYTTVHPVGNDPTVEMTIKGLEVRGRSGLHQVDRIANYALKPPFSYPYRLLVEVKYHQGWDKKKRSKVGIDVIRNAVGVLKDVSEYWTVVPPKKRNSTRSWEQAIPKSRYHYQYMVITSTSFTGQAQAYAFAHDVYLIPMARSRYFWPILHAIDTLATAMQEHVSANATGQINLSSLRQMLLNRIPPLVREWMDKDEDLLQAGIPEDALQPFRAFCQACQRLRFVVLATLGEQFPLVLIPDFDQLGVLLDDLLESESNGEPKAVALRRDPDERGGWLLQYHGIDICSFDLPLNLLKLYIEQGIVGFQDESVSTLSLDATLVNLDRYVEGFDTRPYTVKLSLSRDVFRQFVKQVDQEILRQMQNNRIQNVQGDENAEE